MHAIEIVENRLWFSVDFHPESFRKYVACFESVHGDTEGISNVGHGDSQMLLAVRVRVFVVRR